MLFIPGPNRNILKARWKSSKTLLYQTLDIGGMSRKNQGCTIKVFAVMLHVVTILSR